MSSSSSSESWQRRCVVCVAATPSAQTALEQAGLTSTSFFHSFRTLPQFDVAFRSSERRVLLRGVSLRFDAINDIETRHVAQHAKVLDAISRKLAPKVTSELPSPSIHRLADVSTALQNDADPTPWFTSYLEHMAECEGFAEYEYLDAPVALLVLASTNDVDVCDQIEHISARTSLPDLLKYGFYDTEHLHRQYMLLHVPKLEDPEQDKHLAEHTFDGLREVFPRNACSMVKLSVPNSGAPPIPRRLADALDQTDVEAVREVVADMFVKGIVPQMEARLRKLQTHITAVRKGFRNQLKMFFSKKSASKADEAVIGKRDRMPFYELSSTESQLRQAADCAFLMQDFSLALENYRLVLPDYREDDATRMHYASAQVQIGLCLWQSGASAREIEAAFDSAITVFHQCGSNALASRAAVWCKRALQHYPSSARFVARLFSRVAAKEGPHRAALLLEQAAFVNLRAPVPQLRQYAFCLIRAGHMFQTCQQREHAVRCYRAALLVYQGRGWQHIEDHVNFKLAREFFNLGLLELALQHFVSLLRTGTQSASRQETFMKEFVFVSQKWLLDSENPHRVVEGLTVPKFELESIEAILNERNTLPAAVNDAVWTRASMPHGRDDGRALLDLQRSWKLASVKQCGVVGEPVFITIGVSNPLEFPVKATNIHLRCSLMTDPESKVLSDEFESTSVDLELAPGATFKVELSVCCSQEGILRIHGIEWRALDTVNGRVEFSDVESHRHLHRRASIIAQETDDALVVKASPRQNIPSKTVRRVLKRVRSQIVLTLPEHVGELEMAVIPAQPLLHVDSSDLPTHLLHGEIRLCKLGLFNAGKAGVGALKLCIGHALSTVCVLDDDLCSVRPCDRSGIVNLGSLEAGQRSHVTIAIRASSVGIHQIEMLFRYEHAQEAHFRMPFRLCHIQTNVRVDPLLRCEAIFRYTFSKVDDRVLEIDVANLHQQHRVEVHETSLKSPLWRLLQLGSPRTEPVALEAGDLYTLFGHLVSDTSLAQRSTIQLGSSGSEDAVLDTCMWYFLQREAKMAKPLSAPTRFKSKVSSSEPSRDLVDISVGWQLKQEDEKDKYRRGYTHIVCANALPPANCSLRVAVDFEPQIEHDFEQSPIAEVPVQVQIRNCLESESVTFRFEILPPELVFDSASRSFRTLSGSIWSGSQAWFTGRTDVCKLELQAGECMYIPLLAHCSAPGAYNLNTMKFALNVPDKPPRIFFFPVQRILQLLEKLPQTVQQDQ